jgi:small subunit ribosomal protein S6
MSDKMIAYETTYILRPDVTETAQKTFLDKLKGIITAHSGQVVAIEDWGKRRLAYPIQKESRGYYTYLMFTGNNLLVAELERNLRINEQVIRFLSVHITDDFDATTYKRKPTPNLATMPNVVAAPPAAAVQPQASE